MQDAQDTEGDQESHEQHRHIGAHVQAQRFEAGHVHENSRGQPCYVQRVEVDIAPATQDDTYISLSKEGAAACARRGSLLVCMQAVAPLCRAQFPPYERPEVQVGRCKRARIEC